MGLYEDGMLDPVYQEKMKILNRAIQEIGTGKYQNLLFLVAGFGWFADGVWPLTTGLILTPVVAEFRFNGPLLTLASNIGPLVGAVFWGSGSDVWGRRGNIRTAAGGSRNLVTLASLIAVLRIGVGGNLPVDSAIFLDFLPASNQYLLVFASLVSGTLIVAWILIANCSCSVTATICHKSENMGWRYLILTLGGLTILLWGIGKDEEAVAIIHKIAAYNSITTPLTLDQLAKADSVLTDKRLGKKAGGILSETSNFTTEHVKALFSTRKMAYSTSLLIILWVFSHEFQQLLILNLVGVPAAFCARWAVELTFIGRKGTLAISSELTGIFLFASTTARSSNALLGWNCGYAFNSNIMYGVHYAISSEILPAKVRGTGNRLVSAVMRVFGVIAPIIALHANITTALPMYIADALFISAGGFGLLLPCEPRGKA
ncbi:hypothetical protein K443DRAFT_132193 [Laccaria amethystina LaAM-08-1]|uniref:Major facilitator superfamily (MFS) profile domain-containing protein n=1 Tax=Laccaria amethystina LaAM-08-1 TaxID=1095629 RepID=A0A0C9XVH6_9AGAR|nr:hypothetical protein K443DRAFT_132193 [Laccaria amethystina LaAM-08-1]